MTIKAAIGVRAGMSILGSLKAQTFLSHGRQKEVETSL